MKKATLNYVVDATQSFLLLFLLVSGILQGWVLERGRGYRGGRGPMEHDELLDIDRHTLVTYHKWVAVAFVIFIIAHTVLHWGWITSMSRRIFIKKQHQ
ncbi:MAG: DUF4405 domain-containing protein [Candidatus Brocadiales bacterium]